MNDLQKKIADCIQTFLHAQYPPRQAIPLALEKVGVKLSPPATEYLIQVHEQEIERRLKLIKQNKLPILIESPPLIVVVQDGGSYAKAMREILEENKK